MGVNLSTDNNKDDTKTKQKENPKEGFEHESKIKCPRGRLRSIREQQI
jgi:hypothetical protein